MFLLGHMGITLAAAQILDCALTRTKRLSTQRIQQTPQYEGAKSSEPSSKSWMDIRLVLLGSILPDIIDKPLGHIVLRDTLDNGRIYSHTLLLTIVISLAALYLWKYKHKTWLLPVAFGVFMHLVLDQMWLMHHTLLWPLYGWTFPQEHWEFYWGDMVHKFSLNPSIYIPEIIGGLVLIWFAILIVRRKRLHTFLRNGRLYS